MSNNSSLPPSSQSALVSYYFYAIEGFMIVVSNGLILSTIVAHKVLRSRKEYIILAGLALADLWCALGYFNAGVYRSHLIMMGEDRALVSAWYCMSTAHGLIWSAGEQLSTTMLACVSLDRVIAVSIPLQYFGFGLGYSYCMLAVFYGYSFLVGIYVVMASYLAPRTNTKTAICFMGSAGAMRDATISKYYWKSWKYSAWASIFLFLLAIVIFRRRTMKVGQGLASREMQHDQKQQKRFMVTLGLSTLCTFLFFTGLSEVMDVVSDISQEVYYSFRAYGDNIKLLNPFANLFLFTFRHKDIRMGMRYMFACKHLSETALKTTGPPAGTFGKRELTGKKVEPVIGNEVLEEV